MPFSQSVNGHKLAEKVFIACYIVQPFGLLTSLLSQSIMKIKIFITMLLANSLCQVVNETMSMLNTSKNPSISISKAIPNTLSAEQGRYTLCHPNEKQKLDDKLIMNPLLLFDYFLSFFWVSNLVFYHFSFSTLCLFWGVTSK